LTFIYDEIAARIVSFLDRARLSLVAPEFRRSTRALGDAIERILVDNFEQISAGLVDSVKSDYGRRAMQDVSFAVDQDNYAVDIKTHRTATEFNMPNITSVKRLLDFYRSEMNHFVVVMVKHNLENGEIAIEDMRVTPIEWLTWECLRIANLGWGQIQIRKASLIEVNREQTRATWLRRFVEELRSYYDKEERKIPQRLSYVENFAKDALGALPIPKSTENSRDLA